MSLWSKGIWIVLVLFILWHNQRLQRRSPEIIKQNAGAGTNADKSIGIEAVFGGVSCLVEYSDVLLVVVFVQNVI